MLSASVKSISNVLGESYIQYIVPSYQRGYAWDRTMWSMFWDDVTSYTDPSKNNIQHFFGVIVLMPVESDSESKLRKYLLLDGQQRLITCSMFLAALRDAFPKDSEHYLQFIEIVNGLLFVRHWQPEKRQELTIQLTSQDRVTYENILLGQKPGTDQISRAYLYFDKRIGDSINTDAEFFQALETVSEKFQLVSIFLAPDEDPIPVITNLNARGFVLEEDFIPIRKFKEDPQLVALISAGESRTSEFKQSACRNPKTGRNDNKMRDGIVKAVAALMNSDGGSLLIGVEDEDGIILGVEIEYPTANVAKANWDGYELFLLDLLNSKLSLPAAFDKFEISRHNIEGHDVAWIHVKPAAEPVYMNKKLYVRSGAQTKELQGPDLIAYVNDHWPSS